MLGALLSNISLDNENVMFFTYSTFQNAPISNDILKNATAVSQIGITVSEKRYYLNFDFCLL